MSVVSEGEGKKERISFQIEDTCQAIGGSGQRPVPGGIEMQVSARVCNL